MKTINLANRLTLLRLLLVPVFIIFTVTDNVWTRIFALVIFIVASLTDLYDGYIARKYGQVTNFGKFMDPLADKFLISAAFISFVGLEEIHVPAWMVVFIIGREFMINGLRMMAAAKGVVIEADRSGKFKTTSQITSIITIMVVLCVNSVLERFWGLGTGDLLQKTGPLHILGLALHTVPYWLTFLTTVFTLISGLSYLNKHRGLLAREAGLE